MWSRLLRIFSTALNAWRFSSNPMSFILGLISILIVPYLIYLFWGSLILFVLLGLGIWLMYRWVKENSTTRYP